MEANLVRVLLVEDDEDDYILTRDLLNDVKGQTFRVDWVASAAAAREAAASRQHDVCLLDYRLGGQSGLELLKELVSADYPAPIIVLTGQGDRDVDLEAMRAGAADYLNKDRLDSWSLERAIRYAIERKRDRDALRHLHANLERQVQQRTEALQEADRRKDEFLATLAHELRNPLAPIMHSLQVMQLAEGDEQLQRQARERVERQVGQMVRLIDDLLDLSRITKGKIELRKEWVELAAVVRVAVETSKPLIESAGHHLQVSLPREPVYLFADPTRLAQVLSNLLNNSAKYTERGGSIHLLGEQGSGGSPSSGRASGAGQQQESEILLRVRDTGIGIPPHMLSRIFEMFAQVDRTLERAQGGLGIGLTLVRSLVELHGGTIEALSDGPGQGSEFLIRLPVPARDQGPSLNGIVMGKEPGTSVTRRVLLVDDNRDSAESMALLLRMLGHEVEVAFDGEAALQAMRVHRPEVVLMDIGMPGMNGYEVARRIRQEPELREVCLVAVTGWGQEDDRRRSRASGFDQHRVKPVDPLALQGLLREIGK